MLHPEVEDALRQRYGNGRPRKKVHIKRGDEIFAGTDYPQTFDKFVGQAEAVARLKAAIARATNDGTRLDHTMLASGVAGIGKTTLARIVAYEMGVGIVEVSGPISVKDIEPVLKEMQDHDILFWDEIHQAVQHGKGRAEWLLPFLTDGVLVTKESTKPMPNVTVLGATTDVGKLPTTIRSRFMVWPKLRYYNDIEGVVLSANLAERMGVDTLEHEAIARAADNNPRQMRLILTAIRDLSHVGEVDLDTAFDWAGVTRDGLSRTCQDILMTLLSATEHTASQETLQGLLGEPGPIRHAENQLMQRGLLTITGRGRTLTEAGVERAAGLLVAANT